MVANFHSHKMTFGPFRWRLGHFRQDLVDPEFCSFGPKLKFVISSLAEWFLGSKTFQQCEGLLSSPPMFDSCLWHACPSCGPICLHKALFHVYGPGVILECEFDILHPLEGQPLSENLLSEGKIHVVDMTNEKNGLVLLTWTQWIPMRRDSKRTQQFI